MALLSRGVLTDYDPDEGMFHVTDVQRPALAGATPNPERVYDLVQAFAANGPDPDDYTTDRDSGDEDPHA